MRTPLEKGVVATFPFSKTSFSEKMQPRIFLLVLPSTNGTFHLISKTDISVIEIINVQGEIIYSAQINSNKAEVDLSNFAKGIYFYNVLNKNGVTKNGKIVKE